MKGRELMHFPFFQLPIFHHMKTTGLVFFLSAFMLTSFAQERPVVELTLEDCIQKAIENNIDIKIAKNNELASKANRVQAIMNILPSVNASIDYNWTIGNFFDQTAARQVTATTESSFPGLGARVNVFNGMSNHYLMNQRSNEYLAAQENTRNTELNIRANVLAFYLNVIRGRENIRISEERVSLLQAQLDRAKKRESVGVGNLEAVYNFQSQLANERLTLQDLINTFERNKLILLQSMRLDPTAHDYLIKELEIEDATLLMEIDPFGQVLNESIENNPQFLQANYNLEASRAQLKVASADRYPSISANAGVGSSYSSNGARNPESGIVETDADYPTQMGYNFGQTAGVTLNIPLFNNFRVNNNIQNARVRMANAELSVEQAEQTVTNVIQQVYLDYVSAQATYKSALENLEALQQTFEFMKKRYETGNTDFYTYLESLNNKNRAEIQLINARYNIALRKEVLDAYRMK